MRRPFMKIFYYSGHLVKDGDTVLYLCPPEFIIYRANITNGDLSFIPLNPDVNFYPGEIPDEHILLVSRKNSPEILLGTFGEKKRYNETEHIYYYEDGSVAEVGDIVFMGNAIGEISYISDRTKNTSSDSGIFIQFEREYDVRFFPYVIDEIKLVSKQKL